MATTNGRTTVMVTIPRAWYDHEPTNVTYTYTGPDEDGVSPTDTVHPAPAWHSIPHGPPSISAEQIEAAKVCPAWCVADHTTPAPDAVSPTTHLDGYEQVALEEDEGLSTLGNELVSVTVQTVQTVARVEPLITLDHDSDRGYVELTLDETEHLADLLMQSARRARKAMGQEQ